MSTASLLGRAMRATTIYLVLGSTVQISAEAAPPLALADAVARAIEMNADLRGAEYTVIATRARESKAAQRPPFAIDAELEDFAGTGDLEGTDALQTTLRLSGVLELGGKRGARIAFAERESNSAEIEQRAKRLDLLSEVALRFVEASVRQEHVEVMREASELASTTLHKIADRVAIGAAPPHERARAAIRLARAKIDEEHAEHEFASSRVRLAATWGETLPQFDRVAANLFALPDVPTLDQLLAMVETSPPIQQMLSMERVAEARVRVERTTKSLDLTWSGALRRLEAIDDSAFVATIGVPLGAGRRAEPAIREAEAIRAKAALDTEAKRLAINATLFDLYQELGHAKFEAQTLREAVLPDAQAALPSIDAAFRQGRISFFELGNAQQELLSVRRDAITSAGRYHALLIEIERLTGAAFDSEQDATGEEQ